MRQDAVTLERFYSAPLGQAATRILSGKLTDLWGEARGLSLLGLGFAIPRARLRLLLYLGCLLWPDCLQYLG